MKLFYSPGACSLVPHTLLVETGLPYSLVRVDIPTHKTVDGGNYYGVNSKGSVPSIELDDGSVLTEGPIIAQYICDRAGRTDLMPAAGTMQRYRVMEWQNYITSDLHKSYSPLFRPDYDAAAKGQFRKALRTKYEYVDSKLRGRNYLTGDTLTAADLYLFVVTRWAPRVEVDLSGLDALQAFMERVNAHPSVQKAVAAEAPKT